MSLLFDVIYHKYIDIHNTKNQAENMFTSCSFRFLKTRFHIISHCISEPYLEGRLCQLGKELDNYFMKINATRACKCKTFGFPLHIELPSYTSPFHLSPLTFDCLFIALAIGATILGVQIIA